MSVSNRIVRSVSLLLMLLCGGGYIAACTSQPPQPASGLPTLADNQDTDDQERRVSPQLSEQFNAVATGQFIPVIIRLTEKSDLRTVDAVIQATSKSRRRTAVIAHLQQTARRSQAAVLNLMSELEAAGLARFTQSLWIGNAISAEVKAAAVDYLVQETAVARITADTAAPLFLADNRWNIDRINAPDVWTRPAGAYTGEGVVVAILDSGADLDHPDLVKRLRINAAEDIDGDGRFSPSDNNGLDDDANGFVDDVIGWDFASADNDPSPDLFEAENTRGHGTHVAGIVAGDGTNGVLTGIAPGARMMILKVKSQSSVWAAMQYALTNGADIINVSMGWTNSLAPDLGTWRDAIGNLTDAGVLVVTGAGSGGQAPLTHAAGPGDITTPGRVPRALTVGALAPPKDRSWLDPIAPFSSQGPVSWQAIDGFKDYPFPPGLRKPDITAPGVDITSTMIGGSYAAKSGTSMAAPHVAGVAALMLEQNPELLPHELVFILRETAWRFVDPNNVRGWGRVDAYKAVNHIYDQTPYDLAVADADRLWRSLSIWIDNNGDGRPDKPVAGMTNRVYARMRNVGGKSAGNVEMRFYSSEAGTISSNSLVADPQRSPGDGTFQYIGSYFAPVVGARNTTQDTIVGAVDWIVPLAANNNSQWGLAVEVIASDPPNAAEINRANNIAFTNQFDITLVPGQVYTFPFWIHSDRQNPLQAFDLQVERRGLSPLYEVELTLDDAPGVKWGETARGFVPVSELQVAEFRAGFGQHEARPMKLVGDRGYLERIALSEGRPVAARLVIRAPDIESRYYVPANTDNQYIVISTAKDSRVFGGLALKVAIDPDAIDVKDVIFTEK